MERFYKDEKTAEELSAAYVGKTMGEIQDREKKLFDAKRPAIDLAHGDFVKEGRKRMLTVGKLVEWLQKQDQDACVLAWEDNSCAYIEQMPDVPNCDVCTVEKCREDTRESLRQWYRGTEGAEEKIEHEIETMFRYAEPGDVIIKFC